MNNGPKCFSLYGNLPHIICNASLCFAEKQSIFIYALVFLAYLFIDYERPENMSVKLAEGRKSG
jgi:hypothetical protein